MLSLFWNHVARNSYTRVSGCVYGSDRQKDFAMHQLRGTYALFGIVAPTSADNSYCKY